MSLRLRLESDSENAERYEHDTENDGRDEEEFLEAALRVEILCTITTTQSTTNTCGGRLKEDRGNE